MWIVLAFLSMLRLLSIRLCVETTATTPHVGGSVGARLEEFFGERCLQGSLPDTIERWLASHDLSTCDDFPTPIAPLAADSEGARLSVRLIVRGGERLLLLQRKPLTDTPACPRSLGLSPREADVMAWVAQGKTNAETAIILGLSRRTVDKHLEHIYIKLGVENRLSAVTRFHAAFKEPAPVS
jgi:DNA-binding CsgD family transcriptional regulator